MATVGESSSLKLRDLVVLLRRRWPLIAATVVVAVAIGVGASQLLPVDYRSSAEILLTRTTTRSLFDTSSQPFVDPARRAETELRILESPRLKDVVKARVGVAVKLSARAVRNTELIQLSAESRDPHRAAEAANAYADAYLVFRRQQDLNDLAQSTEQLRARVADLQRQIDQAPVAEKDALVQAQAYFRQQLDQLQVDAARTTSGARLITRATAPIRTAGPTPVEAGTWALVVGLAMALGLAVLLESLDDSIRSKEDLERLLPAFPVVGVLPLLPRRRDAAVLSLQEPRPPAAEAFSTLRTAMLVLKRPLQVVQVTSPGPDEGKTTIVANLAVALARAGHRVVVLDCDLRRPRIHELFGLTNEAGVMSVLLGDDTVDTALQPVREQNGLRVLASGRIPPNPSEILLTSRMRELVGSLRQRGDFVLLDSPPILPVSDSLVISGLADATMVAVRSGTTRGRALRRAVELLDQAGARSVGLVLNGATTQDSYGYYSADYSAESGKRRGQVLRRSTG